MSKSTSTTRTIATILAGYIGGTVRVENLKVHADPGVAGVYAARLYRPRDETMDFLVNTAGSIEEAIENVEEVEFESWPPKQRSDGGFGNIFS